MVMGALNRLGVWVGECRDADHQNPGGFFENRAFNEHRNRGESITLERIKAVLANEGYENGPWAFKDSPVQCVEWEEHFNPLFVMTWRDPRASARSREKCFVREAPFTFEGAWTWALGDQNRLIELDNGHRSVCWVYPDELVAGNLDSLKSAVDFCGLDWNEDAVREWINPEWWHEQ